MSSAAKKRAYALALLVVVFAMFYPVSGNEFLNWDDPQTIAQNPELNPPTLKSLIGFWSAPHEHLYIPVTYTVWAVLAWTSGGTSQHPHLYHTVNLLLHGGSTLLVFLLLGELFRSKQAAFFGAALFAVHPVQVEAVAWASGTKDLLAGLFGLGALYLHVRWQRSVPAYLAATGLFILAMLSKPTAVVVPLMAGAIDGLILRRPWRSTALRLLPWLLLTVAVIVIGRLAQTTATSQFTVPLLARPFIALDALAFYVYKLLLPVSLAPDYGRSPLALFNPPTDLAGLAAIGLIIAVALIANGSSWPRLTAAVVIFVAALLPVLGLVPFDFQDHSTVADHYLYLAMLAPAALLAWWMRDSRSRLLMEGAALILIMLAVRTHIQSRYWKDSVTIFDHTARVNPRSATAYLNSAIALAEQNRLDEAAVRYRAALRIDLANAAAHLGLGKILAIQGQFDPARNHLLAAAQLAPLDPLPHYNLAILSAQTGHIDDAIGEYGHTLQLAPEFAEAHSNFAALLLENGSIGAAIAHYQQALKLNPRLELAQRGLAAALAAKPSPASPATVPQLR